MTLDITMLRSSWERAKTENGGQTALGMAFYKRLFEKYPAVKPLFTTPPEEQHKKLMASINAIIASVTDPQRMMPYLHAMGVRHLAYKTETAHYPAVAENLLAVLNYHLSQEGEWTQEMESQWSAALNTVAGVMIEAAEHPEQFQDELVTAGFQPDGFKANDPKPWELPGVV